MIGLALSNLTALAQDVELSDNQLNFNILPLTASYEIKVDDNKSFTLSAGVGFTSYYSTDFQGGSNGIFIAVPFVNDSFRNYYSRKHIKKDNLKNNSNNYFSLYTSYQFETFGNRQQFQ